MKYRKLISFLVALICVTAMIWMEISITPLTGWKLVPVALLISAIGIGRMYLFYEGTALREVGTRPARIAFRMSILISLAFAGYVTALLIIGKADWYQFSLFQLGNIVLLCVEWIFSFRQGAAVNTRLHHFRNRSLAMKAQAEKFRMKWRNAVAENATLSAKLLEAESARNQLSEQHEALSAEIDRLRKELSAIQKLQSATRKPADSAPKTRGKTASESAESAFIPPETLAELRAEFPDANAELAKVSAFPNARKAKNRRDYLRKLEREGSLNGQATEYEILKRLTL